eukprot:1982088-Amphidinium_carterae.1
MADDVRLVLSHELTKLTRGSTFSESHLASVCDLAIQCQQVLGRGSTSLSSHSGGHLTIGMIASFNVGGLRQKLEGVLDLNFDLVALQEVGAARTHSESLRCLAARQNWQLSFGPTPLAYRDAMGRKRVNPSLGVVALSKCSNGLSNMDHDFEPLPSLGPRLSSWFFIQGHFECYVHVVYVFTCAEDDWTSANMNLIAALRKRIAQKKGTPQLVMGDFQTDIRSQLAMCDFFHEGWLSSTCVVVKLDPGVAPDRSGWRLPKPCMSDASNWGKVAHESGLPHELWWKEQLLSLPRGSTQEMFDYWLSCFNSWLDIHDPKDETYAQRGCCGSYFTSELGGRGALAIQGAAWKIHILKKTVAYTKEYKSQIESAMPCRDRCDLLASKFGKLPLASFNLEHTLLSDEPPGELFTCLLCSRLRVMSRLLAWRLGKRRCLPQPGRGLWLFILG